MKLALRYLVKIFSYFYSKLICLNLYIIHIFYKNIYHNQSIGFGDTFAYTIKRYLKIKRNGYFLNLGFITNQTGEFLFPQKKIINLFFYIHKYLPHYKIIFFLNNCRFFKPKDYYGNHQEKFLIKNKDSIKNLIKAKLNIWYKNHDPFNPNKIFGEKYICLAVKNIEYSENKITGPNLRGTQNFDPLFDIIKVLSDQNYNFCVLNNEKDYFIKPFKNKLKKNNIKNVKFLIDYSKNYSLADQINTALNSYGLISSPSGITNVFYLLQKKIVHINCPDGLDVKLDPSNPENESKYCKYLYKKYFNNGKIKSVPLYPNSDEIPYLIKKNIIENSSDEIMNSLKNFILDVRL